MAPSGFELRSLAFPSSTPGLSILAYAFCALNV